MQVYRSSKVLCGSKWVESYPSDKDETHIPVIEWPSRLDQSHYGRPQDWVPYPFTWQTTTIMSPYDNQRERQTPWEWLRPLKQGWMRVSYVAGELFRFFDRGLSVAENIFRFCQKVCSKTTFSYPKYTLWLYVSKIRVDSDENGARSWLRTGSYRTVP